MLWLVEHWAELLTVGGSAGAGGLAWKFADRWLTHRVTARRQTDEVAMGLVERLTGRLELVEAARESDRKQAEVLREADRQIAVAEHAACEARLSVLRHELKNVEGRFDAVVLAIRHAPGRAAEIVADVLTWSADRKAEADRIGEARQAAQRRESLGNVLERVVEDARAGAG